MIRSFDVRAVSRCSWLALLGALGCSSSATPPDDSEEKDDTDDTAVCAKDADCDDRIYCNGAEKCDPNDSSAASDGCVAAETPCDDDEVCQEDASGCLSPCEVEDDDDGDGHVASACGGDDCDDQDPSRYPGNAETCDDAHKDEDCDPTTFGETDEDGDGYVSSECCNVEGTDEFCGNDCNDDEEGMHPSEAENCDGLDNDCDGSVDEGFECALGDPPQVCITGSEEEGTRECLAICARDICRAEEICNGQDDDGNGGADEDFACVMDSIGNACVTSCGTPGTGACKSDCSGFESCIAPSDVCNYCDDNLANGISEEKELATFGKTVQLMDGFLELGTATQLEPNPLPSQGIYSDFYLGLTPGLQNVEVGGIKFASDKIMGWGGLEVELSLDVRGPLYEYGEGAFGGWGLAFLTFDSPLGGASRAGLPGSSLAFEWNHGHPAGSIEWLTYTDSFKIHGPLADSTFYRNVPGGIPQETPETWVHQELYLKYIPEDPTTQASEEYLLIQNGKGGTTFAEVPSSDEDSPSNWTLNNQIPIGTEFSLMVTAASAGMPFETKVHYVTYYIDDYNNVTETSHADVQYSGLCPE